MTVTYPTVRDHVRDARPRIMAEAGKQDPTSAQPTSVMSRVHYPVPGAGGTSLFLVSHLAEFKVLEGPVGATS